MSYGLKKTRQVVGISPILQTLLIKQISNVIAALDVGNYLQAWLCLRNLIVTSPPKVKRECLASLNEIQQEISKITGSRRLEPTLTQSEHARGIWQLLQQKTPTLLNKVMDELYNGQYLEVYSEQWMGKEIT